MAGKGSPKGTRLGGRQKGSVNKVTADVKAAALVHGPAALKVLADIMINGDAEQARISAANSILDRAYGKPKQDVGIAGKVELTQITRKIIDRTGD